MKLFRTFALIGALAGALLGPGVALADQNSVVMPITGPHTAADLMGNYVNPAFRSVISNYSGSSAPAVGPSGAAVPYQFWFDTSSSPPVLRAYDGTQWVGFGYLNLSTHVWVPYTVEPVNAQTTSYTLVAADCGKLVSINSGSNSILSLPQATGSFSTCWADVYNRGVGSLNLTPTTSTINSQLTMVLATGQAARIVSDGTNWQLASSSPMTSGGSRVLLNTITASGAASIADTTSFLSGYQDYEIVLENIIPGTNSTILSVGWQANGSFQTTAYLWGVFYVPSGTTTSYTGGTGAASITQNVSNVAAHGGAGGTINVFNVAQTNFAKHFTYHTNSAYPSLSYTIAATGSGLWPTSGTPYALTGFSIQASSGTVSGTVKVYGKL